MVSPADGCDNARLPQQKDRSPDQIVQEHCDSIPAVQEIAIKRLNAAIASELLILDANHPRPSFKQDSRIEDPVSLRAI